MSEYKTITLSTPRQLDIYMNPQRQRLLKALEITGPMTSKQLSEILQISSSSVYHHIKQLEELGLVALDHVESIHGIQAKFFKKLSVSVSMGGNLDDDLMAERYVLMDYVMSELWNSFKEHNKDRLPSTDVMESGDFTSGIIHLNRADAEKLYDMILDFAKNHSTPGENTTPWEYGVIAFPHCPITKTKGGEDI